MQLFFTDNIQGKRAILGEEESRHCAKVLRKKMGDIISFIDGKGHWYKAEITDLNKKETWLKILEYHKKNKWDFHLHIAIAPTKNISRTEWFLEKCTEIGIDEITFLDCYHSERKKIRLDRLEKIVLSATKQSLKAHLPQLNPLVPFQDFISSIANQPINKYICWVDERNQHFLDQAESKKDILFLIGPEGDFSRKEVEIAQQIGFQSVGLGESRLRTETAGIVACHLAHVLQH